MIRQFLDVIALGTSCVALFFVVKMKATYFLDSRFFMALANATFILLLVQSVATDALGTPPVELLTVFMTFATAMCVGFASFLLLANNRTHDRLGVIGNLLMWPPKQFLVFTGVAVAWLVSGVTLQPWSQNMLQTGDGTLYLYSFDGWFLIFSGVFLSAFILGPVATAYQRASRILDPQASNSVKTISVAWALFGVVALFQEAVTGTLAIFEQSAAIVTNSLLFLAISFAIREPTVLSRMMSEDYLEQSPALRNSIDGARDVEQRQLGTDDTQNGFAALLRLKHDDLKNRRLLVEYDPTSNYENLVKKFADEFCTNNQPVAVFTSVGSPVHKVIQGTKDVKLFSFSAKTSTPSRLSDAEILLPERDASLLLDAIDKLFQTHPGSKVGLAFDVFTDLILFKSFEKAYGVLSSVAEMADSRAASTLVMINETALDPRVLSGVRSLFVSQLSYGKEGLQVMRTRVGATLKTGGELEEPLQPGSEVGGLKG